MRATMFATLATLTLTGCGGLASSDVTGPPEWFLRSDERAQFSAARMRAETGPFHVFRIVTSMGPDAFAARLAERIESCWLAGEPGWTLRRVSPATASAAGVELVAAGGPAAPALRFEIQASTAPGLTVSARGPLAADEHRNRLRRALDRAGEVGPDEDATGDGAAAALNCF